MHLHCPGSVICCTPQPIFQVFWGRWLDRRSRPLLCYVGPYFSWWRWCCWCEYCALAFPKQGIQSCFHMNAANVLLWFGLQWGGGTPRVLCLLPALGLPYCITTYWGVFVMPSAWGLLCMLSQWVLSFGCSSGFPSLWIQRIVAFICPHMTA